MRIYHCKVFSLKANKFDSLLGFHARWATFNQNERSQKLNELQRDCCKNVIIFQHKTLIYSSLTGKALCQADYK